MSEIISPFEVENANSFDTPYEYKLKTLYFCNNTVDFVMTKIKHKIQKTSEAFKGIVNTYPKTLTEEEQEAKRLENVERAARRARQQVHYAVRSLGADHMLTLHTRENIQDRAEFFQIFTKFVRLVREKELRTAQGQKILVTASQKKSWGYVAVSELQDRGALHMHIACVGKQDLDLLRACWYVALGGTENDKGENVKGNIDVQFRERRFSGKTELHKTFSLVGYMTKYITKSFNSDDELGKRRYNASRYIPKPVIMKQFIWSSFQNGGGDFVSAMREVIAIADFQGVNIGNAHPWNRGEDIYILRGEVA